MFYLLRHLRTSLTFSDREIDQIGQVKSVWAKLRNKIQGKYTNEYGLILHITNPQKQLKGTSSIYSLARIDSRGTCSLQIQFSAISFKVQKNDLLYCRITSLSPECITCGLTSAVSDVKIIIKIPRSKLHEQYEYDKAQNNYRLKNKNCRIEVGDMIMCRSFQVRLEMGSQICIIGEIGHEIVGFGIGILS